MIKKLTITSEDISSKQWSDLILELNLIRKAWKPYAKLELKAPSINKIISHGTKNMILNTTQKKIDGV